MNSSRLCIVTQRERGSDLGFFVNHHNEPVLPCPRPSHWGGIHSVPERVGSSANSHTNAVSLSFYWSSFCLGKKLPLILPHPSCSEAKPVRGPHEAEALQ